jgi:hypothetical protein
VRTPKDDISHSIGKGLVNGSVPINPSNEERAKERIDHQIRVEGGLQSQDWQGFRLICASCH